ncbi:hypothetical protein QBC43DRAFT_373017 [Cladorrhinum sp. PSN259]|nr:hypothetical protein QBC43DRAFT_373017 [Cladorrhinum sp. PSN259]
MASSQHLQASISATCTSATSSLATLREKAGHPSVDNALKFESEDHIARLQLWAGNIGALQPPTSAKSLDFRLKDAPQIVTNIHLALQRIADAAGQASRIINGELPNRTTEQDIEVNELNELSLSINSSISTLFRLSMLVRRHRPRGRDPNILTQDGPSTPDDPLDSRHVCDLFPHVRSKQWLVSRLSRAITQRREYIKYRERHRRSLGKVISDDSEGLEATSNDTGTLATTFVQEDSEERPQAKAYSVFTSKTSLISFRDDEDGDGLTVPELSDMVLDGRRLEYDEPFECPFCRTIQTVSDRLEWKLTWHVLGNMSFFDLRPYVCTFEDCNSGLFDSRHEWWQHEIDTHRSKWTCTICPPPAALCGSKQEIESHMRVRHSDQVTEAQLPFLVKVSRTQDYLDVSSCSLCLDWPNNSRNQASEKELARHLARHMQRLSLASVPMHIEGLEMIQPEPDKKSEAEKSSQIIADEEFADWGQQGMGPFKWPRKILDETGRLARGSETFSSSRNRPGASREGSPEDLDPRFLPSSAPQPRPKWLPIEEEPANTRIHVYAKEAPQKGNRPSQLRRLVRQALGGDRQEPSENFFDGRNLSPEEAPGNG